MLAPKDVTFMYSYFADLWSVVFGAPSVLAANTNTGALSKFSMTLIGIGTITSILVGLLMYSKKQEAKKEAMNRQEQELRQQKEFHSHHLAQLQAYATPCAKCKNTALPVRGTRNKYECLHCQHEFFATVHDLPHLT